VKLLLKEGADIDAIGKNGNTALHKKKKKKKNKKKKNNKKKKKQYEAVGAPELSDETRRELDAARAFAEKRRTAQVHAKDEDDSLDAEYGDDIFEHRRKLEEQMKPDASYMDRQDDINWPMRARLMEWLVEVRMELKLQPEVLFIAANYLDRFLSCRNIGLNRLQLAGLTALFIAAKYECVRQIETMEIVAMADGSFTADELLEAERFMLTKLDYNLGWPDPIDFLGRISKAHGKDKKALDIAKCFLDITMVDERFVSCIPSFLSAGAYCLARFMLGKTDWVLIKHPSLPAHMLNEYSRHFTSITQVTHWLSFNHSYLSFSNAATMDSRTLTEHTNNTVEGASKGTARNPAKMTMRKLGKSFRKKSQRNFLYPGKKLQAHFALPYLLDCILT
jgi:hypothetical protein